MAAALHPATVLCLTCTTYNLLDKS